MAKDIKPTETDISGTMSKSPPVTMVSDSIRAVNPRVTRTLSPFEPHRGSVAALPSMPPPSAPLKREGTRIFDDPAVSAGYDSVPLITIDSLPRGGISFETKGVGRIQFGIPPETIKDSMVLGMEVPTVYIVPVERFCRELGHALGLNFAEFEFPAYFNFFVKQKRVQLVVDSLEAEKDIRTVFGETLLGPDKFRNNLNHCENADEDFDPTFPVDARPNFYKEFLNFRVNDGSSSELSTDTLLEFIHFQRDRRSYNSKREGRPKLGVPPMLSHENYDNVADTFCTANEKTRSDERIEQTTTPPTSLRRNSTSDGPKLQSFTNDDSVLIDLQKEPVRGVRRNLSDDGQVLNRSSHHRNVSEGRSLELSTASMSDPKNRNSLGEINTPDSGVSNQILPDKTVLISSGRRGSAVSFESDSTVDHEGREARYTRTSRLSAGSSVFADFDYDFLDDADNLQDSHWMYSQAKWLGEVATIYPPHATYEQKRTNDTARVEIFKMAGGTEYIVHDVDANNVIIGKARFSGTVKVPDIKTVRQFMCSNEPSIHDNIERTSKGLMEVESIQIDHPHSESLVKSFHPPSFGVTVLGNSHGFDKNGSTSGYVLWVNGRGIMIDPPPYSSAALEMEGIRPQTIIAIIITHCHADHDAGAFQKIVTGARVAIITTPTIYKSFIRKYSALSGLSSSLLRQSHRFRPAIIGQPLKMQGAVFHFTYTLHTIPCISFKVEWRGKSIVFTGDHMNIPERISALEEKGILSKKRADDLRQLPLQDCDVLLHESGAPPIHTPLSVLQELPQEVRDRLYIVHTAAIPSDCGLRVAPTGTIGTLRLDKPSESANNAVKKHSLPCISSQSLQDGAGASLTIYGNFSPDVTQSLSEEFSGEKVGEKVPSLVFSRPTDVSDAWFILNLMSAVPFLASLSYAHTMEVLEIANVESFCPGQVVLHGMRRPDFLCVFWEGACRESVPSSMLDNLQTGSLDFPPIVWHAGDWTCPQSLQPDPERCVRVVPGESQPRDIIAVGKEGVKVILVSMKDLHGILNTGSKHYRKYLAIEERQKNRKNGGPGHSGSLEQIQDSLIDVIQFNSVLGSLYPKQRRHLESVAEGPRHFPFQSYLWKVGDPVDFAYIIVAGTATIATKLPRLPSNETNRHGNADAKTHPLLYIDEQVQERQEDSPTVHVEADKLLHSIQPNSEYSRLETVLQLRMEEVEDYDDAPKNPLLGAIGAQRDKFANKVLARLYSRRAYTEHLIFSRGNFLCDTSRMVSGDPANAMGSGAPADHYHTSNMMAGHDGCLAYVIPRSSLVPFLDSNPGVLLSLLGSQVVV
ncbi:metallo-beta-lactamase superfamily protein [Nitzschia inconspicua]|uniref:Metallo-beta-lactamase superfamily protein n=1 Tax=Nitzschia inconspicua TaxID=303405 RepID=A0A9K3KWK6_9STRA|nr:metallo-beta-lactamase superfamily protein [Nitzschia inconspicua]